MAFKCPKCNEDVDGYDEDLLTGRIWHTRTVQYQLPKDSPNSFRIRPVKIEECHGGEKSI